MYHTSCSPCIVHNYLAKYMTHVQRLNELYLNCVSLLPYTCTCIIRRPVYAKEISGRYDIGGLDSYLHCCSHYKPQRQ